jgi:hypothetical protein
MRAAATLAAFALVWIVAAVSVAHAAGAIGSLSEAQARLNAGDYYEARELTAPLLEDESLARADRAEALRLNGLAAFFLGDRAAAEASLLAFLELEPEAHLDPALVPPVGIAFFEDVRNRHWAEISQFLPRPKRRGHWAVNLIPPFGQFQNGDRGKGWALLTTELLLGATAVTTYVILRQDCSGSSCKDPGSDRSLRTVNLTSCGLLAGVWIYGMIDGYVGWRRREAALGGAATVQAFAPAPGPAFGLGVAEGGAQLVWTGRF